MSPGRAAVFVWLALGGAGLGAIGESYDRDAGAGQLRDITGIERSPARPSSWPQMESWLFAAAAAGALGVAAGILRVRKRRPAVDKFETTMSELTALERQGLPPVIPGRQFVAAVAAISRRFIERQFGVAASTRTPEEVLNALRSAGVMTAAIEARLQALLDAWDRGQFSPDGLPPERCALLLAGTREFVAAAKEHVLSSAANSDKPDTLRRSGQRKSGEAGPDG